MIRRALALCAMLLAMPAQAQTINDMPDGTKQAITKACDASPQHCAQLAFMVLDDYIVWTQHGQNAIDWSKRDFPTKIMKLNSFMDTPAGMAKVQQWKDSRPSRQQPSAADQKLAYGGRPDATIHRIGKDNVMNWCRHIEAYVGPGWCNGSKDDLSALAQVSGLLNASETDRIGWGQPSPQALKKAATALSDGDRIHNAHTMAR